MLDLKLGFRLITFFFFFLTSICFNSLAQSRCTRGCNLALASYYVQQGDELTPISNRFNTNNDNILKYNPTIPNQDSVQAFTRINVPFSCDCINGEFLGHVFNYDVASQDTYITIAQRKFANLTTADWIQRFNNFDPNRVPDTAFLNVTVNCSCGDSSVSKEYGLFVTYPLRPEDSLDSVSSAANVSSELIRSYNPGVNFGLGTGLVYIPGRDENGNYLSLKSSSGLSGGAIGGITVGIVAVVLLLAGCFYFGYYKRKKAGSSSALLKNAQVQLMPDQAFQVYHHLQPRDQSTPSSSDADKDKEKATPAESWERLDSIVLQWIYGTISTDLLHTILKPDTTAHQAWTSLANIFQDNKATRTIDLQNKFANTRLDQFPSMSAYCQAMKIIFDQLTNVGSPITDEQLVLQLLTGLTEQYESTGMIIQQTKPLPDFYETRSRLCMAETRKNNQARNAAQAAGTALTAVSDRTEASLQESSDRNQDRGRGRGRGRTRGRGRGNSNRGRGSQFSAHQPNGYGPWGTFFGQWAGPPPNSWTSWNNIPPCPYPTVQRPNSSTSQGILGPRPAQSYAASYAPTNIDQALHTMTLNPTEPLWTMDTGASDHMGPNNGSQDPDPYPTM